MTPYADINNLQLDADLHPWYEVVFVGLLKDFISQIAKKRGRFDNLIFVFVDLLILYFLIAMKPLDIDVRVVAFLQKFQHGQFIPYCR